MRKLLRRKEDVLYPPLSSSKAFRSTELHSLKIFKINKENNGDEKKKIIIIIGANWIMKTGDYKKKILKYQMMKINHLIYIKSFFYKSTCEYFFFFFDRIYYYFNRLTLKCSNLKQSYYIYGYILNLAF